MARVYLSPPHLTGDERALVLDALDSGWVAPLGPHVDAFERELAEACGTAHCAALSSGTAALHLALLLAGVQPGADVLVPTFTFAATANAVTYTGARPVLVDCDPETWQVDPDLLAEELAARAARGRLPAAVVTVDLYGQCADHEPIVESCRRYDVPVIEDAAEALGATYRGRPAGSLGDVGALSFNGNKIITTSGGGALLTDDPERAERARFLATQARDPAPHYQHSTIGFNYRLSNLLAAVGRGQLRTLGERVAARRGHHAAYREALADLPGVTFMPLAGYGESSCWLTCVRVDPPAAGVTREALRLALEAEDIEARPVWKPMHLQPVFAELPRVRGEVAAAIFDDGLCLPSGSALAVADRDRVIEVVRRALGAPT